MTDRLRELFAGSSRSSGTPEFKHVSVSLKKKKKTTKNASSESKEPERADISRSDGDGLGMQLPAERLSSKIVSNGDKDERTVFVGNLPLTVTKKNIKKLFMQCGRVESLRFRSMAIAPGRLPVGVARKVHRQLTGSCVNCYVVFESKQAVDRSLELNGTGTYVCTIPELYNVVCVCILQIWVDVTSELIGSHTLLIMLTLCL